MHCGKVEEIRSVLDSAGKCRNLLRPPDDEVTGQVKLAKKSVKSMVSGLW